MWSLEMGKYKLNLFTGLMDKVGDTAVPETDPVFEAWLLTVDPSNWDTAYGWGDHASAGYLTSESDPVFTAHPAFGITSTDITNLGNLSGTNTGDQDLSPYALTTALADYVPYTGANQNLTLGQNRLFVNGILASSIYRAVAVDTSVVGSGRSIPLAVTYDDPSTNLTGDISGMNFSNNNTTNNSYSGLMFSTRDTGGTALVNAFLHGVHTSHTPSAMSTELVFGTRNAGTLAERMRLASSGILQMVRLGEATTREQIAHFRVSDASGDNFYIANNSNSNGVFVPQLMGSRNISNQPALTLMGQTTAGNDSGTNPVVRFDARRFSGDELNGTFTSIATRPLFEWANNGTALMTLSTTGLGIGGTPSYALDVYANTNAPERINATNTNTGTSARIGFGLANGVLAGDAAAFNLNGKNYNGVSGWANRLSIQTSSLIANGIVFYTVAGGIQFSTSGTNNPDLFVEPTTGRIGFNTNLPTVSVHLKNTGVNIFRSESTDNTTNSVATQSAYSNQAGANLIAHATARTLTRFGITLGGWAELLASGGSSGTPNGLIIGTEQNVPIVFGTNNLAAGRINGSQNWGFGVAATNIRGRGHFATNTAIGTHVSTLVINNVNGGTGGVGTGPYTGIDFSHYLDNANDYQRKMAIGFEKTTTFSRGDMIISLDAVADNNNVNYLADEKLRLTMAGKLILSAGDAQIPSGNAFYIGDSATDGSWRMIRSGNDLNFERRESGSWVSKGAFVA
jgi:hypothetical protein